MLLYAVSIFVSSFLLFQIQPLIGKYILPWFGGTSSVWSASLLFFQSLLTGGYAYSYWLTGKVSYFRQRWVHISFLFLSLVLIITNLFFWDSPILPVNTWQPRSGYSPLFAVFQVLFVAVGFPYFLLATNSTLMQVWFTYQHPSRSPYQLYAISNAASMIGLIAYPTLVEPYLSLKKQSILWAFIYLIFVLITGFQAWRSTRGNLRKNMLIQEVNSVENEKPEASQYVLWIGLATLGSIILLSTTSKITQEVAAIPLLWILPLAIYLFSFVLTFSGSRVYNRSIFFLLLLISTVAYLWLIVASSTKYLVQIAIYIVLLFSITMTCHGELYCQRPKKENLTTFYLMVSIGGAVGGIFINFVVPFIFKGFWEFQVGLGVIWILIFGWLMRGHGHSDNIVHYLLMVITAITMTIVIAAVYKQSRDFSKENVASQRNFYGVLSVKERSHENPDEHRYVLTHGITTHGYQFLSSENRYLPTAYYVEDSGVGIGFTYHPARPGTLRVGVIGLGVGVLAAYGEAEDEFIFYEIDPAVLEVAKGEYFSYLDDTEADVEVVLGDGRISLEREMKLNGPNTFDYIIVDAFNSDAIPTHLLTKEAFELYLKHLKPDGILAIHISNRYLNLRPVVYGLADTLGIEAMEFYHTSSDIRSSTSAWILLTNNRDFLANPQVIIRSEPRDFQMGKIRPWTDDYSNLIKILK